MLTASADQCLGVIQSQLISEIFKFLGSAQATSLQRLGRLFYNVAIGRVLTRLSLSVVGPLYFINLQRSKVYEMDPKELAVISRVQQHSLRFFIHAIQVGADVYELRSDAINAYWDMHTFTKTQLAGAISCGKNVPSTPWTQVSLAVYQNKAVFKTGGLDKAKDSIKKSVEIYCIDRDQWQCDKVPELNHGRCMHSSCTLGDRLYVFGGKFFNERD